MKTIQATSTEKDGAIQVAARIIDEEGAVVLAEVIEWPAGTPMADVARETRRLLQAKMDRLARTAPVAVAGLDGEALDVSSGETL